MSVEILKQIQSDLADIHKRYSPYALENVMDCIANGYSNGIWETIDQEGGEEDGPRYSWTIIKYKDRFFKLNYEYDSWDDNRYDASDFKEVFPVEKTIIVYE